MKNLPACVALICLAFASSAAGAPATDDAGRTTCQAYARVLKSDLDGQRVMIDQDLAISSPTEADAARLTRRKAQHDADARLYNALVQQYASAARPTPEAMANLRNNTSMAELRRLAQACL